jgi:glutathione peroxidase-family protein
VTFYVKEVFDLMTAQTSASIYDISATGIDGNLVSLSTYKDKVLLIVNTASQCGFTPQYQGLQALYDQYANQGLVVLGFPCNQFGQQESGNSDQIQSFCETNFGVSFQLFQKIKVNGGEAHPLYQYLTKAAPGILGTEGIKWNFTKFLVDRGGKVVKRYPPTAKPEDLVKDIQALL